MKKEKTVRTYQRRTKSGKMVTVREHKASYDAAEEARKAAAKKAGAGSELSKKKAIKEENPLGFSEADYKEWYHWDMENDANNEAALRVEKALTKKMGKKAYNKYLEDMSNSYSARGHKKAHQSLLDEYTAQQKKQDAESSKAAKDIARGAKKKDAEAKASKVKEVKSSSTSGTYSVSYRGADGKTHVETFSDKESADDFRRNVAAGGYLPRGMFLLGRKEESKPTSAKTKSEVPKKFDYVMMHDGKDGRKGYRVSDGRIWTKGADGKMTEVKLSSLPKEIQRLYKENEKDFDRSKKKSKPTSVKTKKEEPPKKNKSKKSETSTPESPTIPKSESALKKAGWTYVRTNRGKVGGGSIGYWVSPDRETMISGKSSYRPGSGKSVSIEADRPKKVTKGVLALLDSDSRASTTSAKKEEMRAKRTPRSKPQRMSSQKFRQFKDDNEAWFASGGSRRNGMTERTYLSRVKKHFGGDTASWDEYKASYKKLKEHYARKGSRILT